MRLVHAISAQLAHSIMTVVLVAVVLAGPALADGDGKDVGEADYNVADCSEDAGEKAAPENAGGEIESDDLDEECEPASP